MMEWAEVLSIGLWLRYLPLVGGLGDLKKIGSGKCGN